MGINGDFLWVCVHSRTMKSIKRTQHETMFKRKSTTCPAMDTSELCGVISQLSLVQYS